MLDPREHSYVKNHVTRATPLSGMVSHQIQLDTACKHTKFDDALALAVLKIFHGVCNSKIGQVALTTPTYEDSLSSEG